MFFFLSIRNLIRDRDSFSRKVITTENTTKEGFLKQIEIELNLIDICKLEIKVSARIIHYQTVTV